MHRLAAPSFARSGTLPYQGEHAKREQPAAQRLTVAIAAGRNHQRHVQADCPKDRFPIAAIPRRSKTDMMSVLRRANAQMPSRPAAPPRTSPPTGILSSCLESAIKSRFSSGLLQESRPANPNEGAKDRRQSSCSVVRTKRGPPAIKMPTSMLRWVSLRSAYPRFAN